MDSKYDLIIVGGGTAGVSCAWNAAKLGLKTLIIEQNSYLGGSITSSLVIPAMKTSDNAINTNFFNELYNKLISINGAITFIDGNRGWFNPELTKIALDLLMREAGVDILFETLVRDISIKDSKCLSVSIESIGANNNLFSNKEMLLESIESIYLVDATGDAKICQKLNCAFLNDDDNSQPQSLRFIMSGVDTKSFATWLKDYDTDRETSPIMQLGDSYHLSTAYTWDSDRSWALKPLMEDAIAKKILEYEDSNYFQLFSIAGTTDSIAFNAPRLVNTKGCNSYIEARMAILRLSNFCKKYLPGFKNAHISSIANSMGVRVSKRVKGKYIYTYEDLISGKKFSNPVLISNYPVDIHSEKKDCSRLEKVYKEYQLPLESLKVDGWDNLFVIGRCISADFKSQAALRIIPSCLSMGEGLAKHLAKCINCQNC